MSAPRACAIRALLPSLRMGVERKVVGGEAHVRVEQQLQATLHAGVDGRGVEPQKSPWWTMSRSAWPAMARSNSSALAVTPVASFLISLLPGNWRPLGQ